MLVSEVFYSVQGEGTKIGCPSIFIRLGLCNLHCIWCDTAYTWNWEGTNFEHKDNKKYDIKKELITMTADDVINKVNSLIDVNDITPNIVITGGEPLLHQTDKEFLKLLKYFDGKLHYIEVETNGTIAPSQEIKSMVGQYNVGLKLSNSNNEKHIRIKPEAINSLVKLNSFFKFVIISDDDMKEAMSIVREFNIPKDQIIFIPEGRTSEELKERSIRVSEYCKKHNYRYGDRLQIHLFGNTRST